MKSIKVSRGRSRSKKRILLEKEEEVTKCLVIGSSNSSVSKFIKSFQKGSESYLPENEASFRWNETDFVLWRGNDQTGLKKALLKQYLIYHGAQVLFYLVNDRDIEVRPPASILLKQKSLSGIYFGSYGSNQFVHCRVLSINILTRHQVSFGNIFVECSC